MGKILSLYSLLLRILAQWQSNGQADRANAYKRFIIITMQRYSILRLARLISISAPFHPGVPREPLAPPYMEVSILFTVAYNSSVSDNPKSLTALDCSSPKV